MYTAIITHFSERPDGQWLTTGAREIVRNLDRAGVERLVADRAGPGVQFSIGAVVGTEEAESEVGGSKLRWIEDDAILAARDRVTFGAIAASAEMGEPQ